MSAVAVIAALWSLLELGLGLLRRRGGLPARAAAESNLQLAAALALAAIGCGFAALEPGSLP